MSTKIHIAGHKGGWFDLFSKIISKKVKLYKR